MFLGSFIVVSSSTPIRRPPPPFRRVEVTRIERRSPRLVRITVGGPELAGLTVDEPGASVRLLLGDEPTTPPELPEWTGNEFLLADGTRPIIRTLTPRRWDDGAAELTVDIVDHGHGPMSVWAASAQIGWPTAISGTGRGYDYPEGLERLVLIGDESAVPAIGQLAEQAPAGVEIDAHVVMFDAAAEHAIDGLGDRTVTWHPVAGIEELSDVYASVAGAIPDTPGSRWWVAGEAAAVQRVRKLLFDERAIDRKRTTVRGYWKRDRPGD